jgi:hypothetical protein
MHLYLHMQDLKVSCATVLAAVGTTCQFKEFMLTMVDLTNCTESLTGAKSPFLAHYASLLKYLLLKKQRGM